MVWTLEKKKMRTRGHLRAERGACAGGRKSVVRGAAEIPGAWLGQGEEHFQHAGVATSKECSRDRGGDGGNERSQVTCKSSSGG